MKEFFAYKDCECEKCGGEILQDEQFFYFNDEKICEDCWNKLVALYEAMK